MNLFCRNLLTCRFTRVRVKFSVILFIVVIWLVNERIWRVLRTVSSGYQFVTCVDDYLYITMLLFIAVIPIVIKKSSWLMCLFNVSIWIFFLLFLRICAIIVCSSYMSENRVSVSTVLFRVRSGSVHLCWLFRFRSDYEFDCKSTRFYALLRILERFYAGRDHRLYRLTIKNV